MVRHAIDSLSAIIKMIQKKISRRFPSFFLLAFWPTVYGSSVSVGLSLCICAFKSSRLMRSPNHFRLIKYVASRNSTQSLLRSCVAIVTLLCLLSTLSNRWSFCPNSVPGNLISGCGSIEKFSMRKKTFPCSARGR